VVLMRARDSIDAATVSLRLEEVAREGPLGGGATLHEVERNAILEALRASGWNQSRAARRLGVARHILLYRMKKFAIREEGDTTG
jgi:transcriptional regulator with GAF, ATPase, and Fis domain